MLIKNQAKIFWETCNGHKEVFKILVTLADIPNAPNKFGVTPIHEAASNDHLKIVKILVLFQEFK